MGELLRKHFLTCIIQCVPWKRKSLFQITNNENYFCKSWNIVEQLWKSFSRMVVMIVRKFSYHIQEGIYSLKNGVNFHSFCHWRHSLGSDVSDHFFWTEYRVIRTRFHSLRSEFSLHWSENRVKFTPQRVKISSLHGWSEVYLWQFRCLEFTHLPWTLLTSVC